MIAGLRWPSRISLRAVLRGGFAAVIALTIAAGLAAWIGQQRSVDAITHLLQVDGRIAELSIRSNVAMLKARRAEKDFLIYQHELGFDEARSRYVTLLRTAIAEIRQGMAEIRDLELHDLDHAPTLAAHTREIEATVDRYEAGFFEIVDLYGRLGRGAGGLEGQLREAGEEIEALLRRGERAHLMVDLLRLRNSEQDFKTRGLPSDAQAFRHGIRAFEMDLAAAGLAPAITSALAALARQYLAVFESYAETTVQIEAKGAAYLQAARAVEPVLDLVHASTTERAAEMRHEVQSVARAATITIIGAGMVALLLGSGVAELVSRRISRSVKGCLAFANRLAAGDWDTRLVPGGASEFATAAIALNGMAEALQASRRSLEDKAAELQISNAELQKEGAERKQLTAQLVQAQKMESLGRLTGGLSHDFNNLLGIITCNLDLLEETLRGDATAVELIDETLDAAMRGADLNRSLLAFARRQPLQPERIEVNELVAGITTLLQRTLGEDIRIRLSVAADIWPVVVDPAQLEAAITNLATNARDAMPGGGGLTIATRNCHLDGDYAAEHAEVEAGDYVAVEVTDTGTGMSPEVLAHVFEPFFTTKGVGKGTGLGLAMLFGFVKQSNGHVQVYSEVGRGTTVRIYLPRAIPADAAIITNVAAPALIRGSEVVLVVEDNEGLRRGAVRQLLGLGYRVFEAADAAAALDILRGEEAIDLLFTDIVMPGGSSGWDLARAALALRPGLKVLFTSGFPEAAFGQEGARPPGCILLSKPYRKRELAERIRAALAAVSPTLPAAQRHTALPLASTAIPISALAQQEV